MDVVKAICDEVALMSGGKIVDKGADTNLSYFI
jgi:ABC-type methionine transport system ATPase subunit